MTEEEENSPWNRLYNLMNPTSSYNESIQTASAIYCTDWDKYYIFKGEVDKALKDAYNAPIFVNDPDLEEDLKRECPSNPSTSSSGAKALGDVSCNSNSRVIISSNSS